jgi:hypothetical protein
MILVYRILIPKFEKGEEKVISIKDILIFYLYLIGIHRQLKKD